MCSARYRPSGARTVLKSLSQGFRPGLTNTAPAGAGPREGEEPWFSPRSFLLLWAPLPGTFVPPYRRLLGSAGRTPIPARNSRRSRLGCGEPRHQLLLSQAQDPVLLAYLPERLDGPVEVMLLVGGGELGADAGLTLRHHRKEESHGIDPLGEQVAGKVLGQLGVVQHDRHDRALALLDIEAGLLEQAAPVAGVPFQL